MRSRMHKFHVNLKRSIFGRVLLEMPPKGPEKTDATLLANNSQRNIVGCYMSRPFANSVSCCCCLLGVVEQSLKPAKVLATCKWTQQFGLHAV